MKKLIVLFSLLAVAIGSLTAAPEPADTPTYARGHAAPSVTYARGHVSPTPAVLAMRHSAAAVRHSARMATLPTATPAAYDLRESGKIIPPLSQGNCGSCWDFSGIKICTNAIIRASDGKIPNDGSFILSPQYVLDCVPSGGCSGDDNTTVLQWAKVTGIPTVADYGPYRARRMPCKSATKAWQKYRITDWGYCTPNQSKGVASVQDVKNCLLEYGSIGSAVAADRYWDAYQSGQILRNTSTQINHDVLVIGWDDHKGTKGCWLVMNSWGAGWGDQGTCWIEYGADRIGYEAVWASAGPLPPAPQPLPPIPPQPQPPKPADCTPYWHLFGTPHWRCDGEQGRRRVWR